MIKGFKEFLLRGNIVDLAVAVVIGVAFTDLVKSFTSAFMDPVIKTVMGGGITGGKVEISEGDTPGPADNQFLDFGTFLNAALTFIVTAAVVYFVFVLPLKKLNEKRQRGEEPAPEPAVVADDVLLLQEIRDLLAAQRPGGSSF